ncbi:MAG TPA: hypothetical protein VIF09_24505 [Polyangiaceae bacterium]
MRMPLAAFMAPVVAVICVSLGACGASSGGSFPDQGEGGASSGSGGSGGGSSGSSSGGGASSSGGGSSGAGSSSGSASSSGGSSSGSTGCTTNTGPISGSVGASGGSISRLVFAIVGDTRPAGEDDGTYPTTVINPIYQDIQNLSPRPAFVVGTGDYQFSNASSGTGAQQVGIYMQARALYSGAFFPAMGNHECGVSGGFSTSDNNNCGPGNQGGATVNYNAFMDQMLKPISQSNPYYAVNVNASDKSWTAKIVVTAANAWDSAQQSWLTTTMAQKTTYTFVVRHEPSDAYPPLPPGVAGVDAVLASAPYTLLLTGHSHTYGHWSSAPKVIVMGNGGAPLSSKDYGFGLISQRCDGAIVADEIDYKTGATDSYFHFVVKPDGTATN